MTNIGGAVGGGAAGVGGGAMARAPGVPSADSDGGGLTAGGGISRLNAFDGLFLRAEHLNWMQDYARELARALGAAGGPGIVEGYEVTLSQGALLVGAGLAIDANGQPLRSRRQVSVPLDGLTATTDTFWWVEATARQWAFGAEAVQGVLCDEPCSGGATLRPYLAEGVEISLRADTMGGLDGQGKAARRPWLASRLFGLEQAGAWPGAAVPSTVGLLGLDWTRPHPPLAKPTGVALAVLVPDGTDDVTGWEVDQWAARRDRGAPPPARAWQWRLGQRPWDVFVAQLLHFQDLLADRVPDRLVVARPNPIATLLSELANLGSSVLTEPPTTSRDKLQRLRDELVKAQGAGIGAGAGAAAGAGGGAGADASGGGPIGIVLHPRLTDLGIYELPPAGFLPVRGADRDSAVAEAARLLGREVRACAGQLADVGRVLADAQHRARIPLGPAAVGAAARRPAVDILVPLAPDGSHATDWVVFAAQDGVTCRSEAAVDAVEIHVLDHSGDQNAFDTALSDAIGGDIPDGATRLGTVTYPAGTWAVPVDDGYATLLAQLPDPATKQVVPVAYVRSEERRPLGAARATLLASVFTPGAPAFVAPRAVVPPSGADAKPEAIVVLAGPPSSGEVIKE